MRNSMRELPSVCRIAPLLLLLVACREGKRTADGVVIADAAVKPAKFTVDDFRRLSWLQGRWEGFMPDGKKFYEAYTVDNDSTITMRAYTDSTFNTQSYVATIGLRKGIVTNKISASAWAATRLDSTGADFGPYEMARNRFTWTREDSSKWNVTFRATDQAGRPQTTVYAVHRYGR